MAPRDLLGNSHQVTHRMQAVLAEFLFLLDLWVVQRSSMKWAGTVGYGGP